MLSMKNFHLQVSLRQAKDNRHFCSGSLVNSQWILTAAHCFTFIKDPAAVAVQYGSVDLESVEAAVSKVSEIILHEGYNPTIAIHDIALLRLKEDLPYSNTVKPVTLGERMQKSATDLTGNVTLIGWGLNATGGQLQQNLQKVQLTLLDLADCRARTQAFLHETNLCTWSENRGQCSGDSGGPLLQSNGTQIGIVSWSLKPCGEYPGVYTHVAYYIDWISGIAGENI